MAVESSTERQPSTTPVFLTPSEVCARWRIDARTLDKLALPWVRLTPRTRRIALAVIVAYEAANPGLTEP